MAEPPELRCWTMQAMKPPRSHCPQIALPRRLQPLLQSMWRAALRCAKARACAERQGAMMQADYQSPAAAAIPAQQVCPKQPQVPQRHTSRRRFFASLTGSERTSPLHRLFDPLHRLRPTLDPRQ
jgi:hypothetical protein